MTTLKREFIDRIADATATAKGIAFDGCHKIYILMDDAQMDLMREYGYDPLISSSQMTPNEMTDTVVKWFEESCGLRFVYAVSTVKGDSEFDTVIGQGEVEEGQCSSCNSELDYDSCKGMCESCLSDEYGCCCDCNQSFYYVSQSSEDNSYCSDCYVEEDDEDD